MTNKPILDTDYIRKCLGSLELALKSLESQTKENPMYDVYRAACIKEFELILEQSGKVLKKFLRPFFASNREVDLLTFKDIFRHAAIHNIISLEESERWANYRDNRNETAHDYGEGFAESTLILLPDFIMDVRNLLFRVSGSSS